MRKGRAVAPQSVAVVGTPPVLDLSADGDTQFKIAHAFFIGSCVFPFNHARRTGYIVPETGAGVPDRAVVIVAPVMLHLVGKATDRHEFEVSLGAIVTLDERGATEGDARTETTTIMPAGSVAPPMIELAVCRPNNHFKISRSTIVALDKTGNTSSVCWSEYSAVIPIGRALAEPPMMETVSGGQMH